MNHLTSSTSHILLCALLSLFLFITGTLSAQAGSGGEGDSDGDTSVLGQAVDAVSAAAAEIDAALGISDTANAAVDAVDAALGISDNSQSTEAPDHPGLSDRGSTAVDGTPGNPGTPGVDIGIDRGADRVNQILRPVETEREAAPAAPKKPDLVAEAIRGTEGNLSVNFRGTIKNIGEAPAIIPAGGEKKITSRLILDYDCDSTVDLRQQVETPFTFLDVNAPGTAIVTSARTPAGTHCFAFATDIGNKIPETNNSNNKSNFVEFVVENDLLPVAEPTDDATNLDTDEETVIGGPAEMVSRLFFQVGTAVSTGTFTNTQGQIFEPVLNYQTVGVDEIFTITPTDNLAFKWETEGFESCTASFADIAGLTSGDTEANNNTNARIDVIEPALEQRSVYSLRCTRSDGEEVESAITVLTTGT